ALELKYKTRRLDTDLDGEAYRLLDQSAQNQGRYDFLLDVARLEQLTTANSSIIGAAVLLTNDSSYWAPPGPGQPLDAAFRLHEGYSLTGELAWGAAASAGTKAGREATIKLAGPYCAAWTDYYKLSMQVNGAFRYLLVNVATGRRVCADLASVQ